MANQFTNPRQYKYKGNVLYVKCNRCGEWLTMEGFQKDSQKKLGIRSNCKKCNSLSHKEWYEKNKEREINNFKIYHQNNKKRINRNVKERADEYSKKTGFDWYKFHGKAKYYVKKYSLRPDTCPICGKETQILLHHPSYESFDMWSYVVFCCKSCHSAIHTGRIACPNPINLLESKSPLKDAVR